MVVHFQKQPKELNLFNLEECFTSPVMVFMLIHQLLPGGQLSQLWKYMSFTNQNW